MPRRSTKANPTKRGKRAASFAARQVMLGDKIRVERRFVVDGKLTSVCDAGVFHGVQAMGSTEHVLLEDKGEVHLIPLPSIAEIVLVESAPKLVQDRFDPSFA